MLLEQHIDGFTGEKKYKAKDTIKEILDFRLKMLNFFLRLH